VTDFITLGDLDRDRLTALIDASAAWKAARPHPPAPWLAGRHVAIVMEKASTRTRVSFEIAVRELGGQATILTSDGTQLARGEPIEDTARVLSRYAHAIVFRTFGAERLMRMATAATVPVINALTDREHPCQIVADLLTIREHRGRLDGLKVAWIGDGNNMAVSWLHAAGALGLTLALACPEGYQPPDHDVAAARDAGATVLLTGDPGGGRGRRRRGHDRRLGVDGAGGRGRGATGRLRRLLRRRCAPGPGPPRRGGPALPAGPPRRGDRR
jgi:ornithine carbamoyltransferase